MIERRRFVLAVLALPLAGRAACAALTPADDTRLAEIEAYLQSVTTLKARFAQIGPSGGLAQGDLYLRRPGLLRLDYDPPSRVRLVAPGDWRLIFWDGSIGQQNVIPIRQTPLGILLDERIKLDGEVTVTGIEESGDELAITVVRPDHRDQGAVTLVFAKRPMELRRWMVIDAQGLETHVLLEDVATGIDLDRELFRWRDPVIFGPPE